MSMSSNKHPRENKRARNRDFSRIEKALRELGEVAECAEVDADFIVTPRDGGKPFMVQVWSAMIFSEKNLDREGIHIAFCDAQAGKVYCYEHNKMLEAVFKKGQVRDSGYWLQLGYYNRNLKNLRTGWQARLLTDKSICQVVPCEPSR